MSLPTASGAPSQLSIRSFFKAPTPKYAPPPTASSLSPAAAASTSNSSPAVPSPPTSASLAPSEPSPSNGHHDASLRIPPVPAGSMPGEATIRLLDPEDATALRRVNALLLPASYPDSFYKAAVDHSPTSSGRFSRVITWSHESDPSISPKVIGGIVCRVESTTPNAQSLREDSLGPGPHHLYIRSLALLSPYRGKNLANAAVENVLAQCMADIELDVRAVTAHVWTENEEGMEWYAARGFVKQGDVIERYYLKLRPDSAWFVKKDVGANVRAALSSQPQPKAQTNPPSTTTAPPPSGTSTPGSTSGQSFQNQRAETEWNDLPAEMMSPPPLAPPRILASASESGTPSVASSRSSSAAPRKKRDRSYPAAAFGS